jgi:hypothetical protein
LINLLRIYQILYFSKPDSYFLFLRNLISAVGKILEHRAFLLDIRTHDGQHFVDVYRNTLSSVFEKAREFGDLNTTLLVVEELLNSLGSERRNTQRRLSRFEFSLIMELIGEVLELLSSGRGILSDVRPLPSLYQKFDSLHYKSLVAILIGRFNNTDNFTERVTIADALARILISRLSYLQQP